MLIENPKEFRMSEDKLFPQEIINMSDYNAVDKKVKNLFDGEPKVLHMEILSNVLYNCYERVGNPVCSKDYKTRTLKYFAEAIIKKMQNEEFGKIDWNAELEKIKVVKIGNWQCDFSEPESIDYVGGVYENDSYEVETKRIVDEGLAEWCDHFEKKHTWFLDVNAREDFLTMVKILKVFK